MDAPVTLGQESAAPERPLGTRVTLGRCVFSLLFSASWMLGSGAYALHCLSGGDRLQALLFAVVVAAQALTLPAQWKQYRLVSGGAVIYIRRNGLQMPTVVSVIVTGLLTLCVSAITVISIMLLHTPFVRQDLLVGLSIIIGVNALLWGFVVYCCYRISQERLQSKPRDVLTIPTEGVWPPPPTQRPLTNIDNSED